METLRCELNRLHELWAMEQREAGRRYRQQLLQRGYRYVICLGTSSYADWSYCDPSSGSESEVVGFYRDRKSATKAFGRYLAGHQQPLIISRDPLRGSYHDNWDNGQMSGCEDGAYVLLDLGNEAELDTLVSYL